MPNALYDTRSILEAGGYHTVFPKADADELYFEGTNTLGVVYLVESVKVMITNWEQLQDKFLRDNAARLSFDPLKAWNCYTVLLTPEQGRKEDASILAQIEEDFRGTRKLVRTGVISRAAIEEALGPLLPLRHILQLAPEDIKSKLAARLGHADSPLRGLLSDVPENAIAANLIGAE